MREKIKHLFNEPKTKIKAKLARSPYYAKFSRVRNKVADKVAEGILKALLATFNAIGPVWNFFFVKAPDGGLSEELS